MENVRSGKILNYIFIFLTADVQPENDLIFKVGLKLTDAIYRCVSSYLTLTLREILNASSCGRNEQKIFPEKHPHLRYCYV